VEVAPGFLFLKRKEVNTNEIDLLKGKILYERIVILAPLISAGLVLLVHYLVR